MSRQRRLLLGGIGVLIVGFAASEHLARGVIERRYHQAVAGRQQLERQFASLLSTHRELADHLKTEQQRSKELSEALASTRQELEVTVGQLSEETTSSRDLRMRLASMQQQMDRLQGELALALEDQREEAASGASGPVQLERIVISDAGSATVQGRVLSIHRDWNFVVVDLGWNAVKIGDILSIYRNEQLLAKARVERVQEGVCAATILPEWQTSEIHINDQARIL